MIGVFAGRGDILVGYVIVLILGMLMGWSLRGLYHAWEAWSFKDWWAEKRR